MMKSTARFLPAAVVPTWHDVAVASNGAYAVAATPQRAVHPVASTAPGHPV